jgi:hypothetical protein
MTAPLSLSHAWPRMSQSGKERVDACLTAGCNCDGATATLTRRLIKAVVTIHVQCDTCGRSVSGSLPRIDHYFFQDYGLWNDELSDHYYEKQRQQRSARLGDLVHFATAPNLPDYQEFLLSPEWRSLRMLVLERAGGWCEACVINPASEVHHVNYQLGWLPPAWLLRAVCRECHERLHIGWAAVKHADIE